MSKIKDKLLKMWRNINKEQALKVVASVVKWVTKGKIEKNTVLAIGGIILALSTSIGPTAIRPEVEAVNKGLQDMQKVLSVHYDTIIIDNDTIIETSIFNNY